MLGIASVVLGWTVLAPTAGLILGVIALRQGTEERTIALWGVWLNAIMLAIGLVLLVGALIALSLGMIALPFIFA